MDKDRVPSWNVESSALALDGLENLYVADTVLNRIRRAWVGALLGQ